MLARLLGQNRSDDLSLSQLRYWMLREIEPTIATHVCLAYEVHGKIEVGRLQASLVDVIENHTVLKTGFVGVEAQPQPVLAQEAWVVVPVVDLEGLPERAQEAELHRLAGRDAREPFNLAAAPLLRVTVIKRAPERSVLIFTLHQMIGDRESLAILARQVAAAYGARLQGMVSTLPTLVDKNAFGGFAVGQKQWLSTPAGQRAQQYWEQQLQQVPVL